MAPIQPPLEGPAPTWRCLPASGDQLLLHAQHSGGTRWTLLILMDSVGEKLPMGPLGACRRPLSPRHCALFERL